MHSQKITKKIRCYSLSLSLSTLSLFSLFKNLEILDKSLFARLIEVKHLLEERGFNNSSTITSDSRPCNDPLRDSSRNPRKFARRGASLRAGINYKRDYFLVNHEKGGRERERRKRTKNTPQQFHTQQLSAQHCTTQHNTTE